MNFRKQFIGDTVRPTKITVDGTDFRTNEWQPFEPGRNLHKFNGPALRYEVTLSIATGYIVHINGPIWAKHWQDLRVARNWLHY